LPEWGLAVRPNDNLGGGDNPYYIEQMWAWVNSHDYLYANYFEVDARDGAHRLMTDRFPNASARYRALVRAPAPAPALPPSGSRAPVAVASPQPSPPSPPSSAPPATPATTAPVAPAPAPETGVPRRAVTALPSVDPGVAAAVRTPLETADPWKDATAACAALLVAAVATAHAGAARRRARCPKPGQVAPAR